MFSFFEMKLNADRHTERETEDGLDKNRMFWLYSGQGIKILSQFKLQPGI